MTQRIIFNFNYSLFCNQCGALIQSDITPSPFGDKSAEFLIDGKSCSACGNIADFNVARSEIKRLKIDEESGTTPF